MTDSQEPSSVRPLDGVKVVEVASFVAAPSAGAIMADLGAQVIKIEPLGGDSYRGLMRPPKVDGERVDFDAAFSVDNRGKRSLALDVSNEAGVAVMHRLVAEADVFMCNMLPSRQQRYRLDPESLRFVNRHLVHATLTGYGTKGEEADRPGYDVTAYFARGGFADLSCEPSDGSPPRFPQAVGDHATGLALLGGILAALRLAERTAEFQVVETSLLSNALWGIAGDLSTALIDGRRPTPRGRHDVVNATVNSYPCGDGRWIMLNMPIPSSFDHFCAIAELEHLLEDPRFDTPRARFDNMNDLVAVIDATMATRSSAEWGALFDEANIVWAPVQTLPEVAQDKQARSNDYFVPLHDGSSGGVEHETVAVPIKIANVQVEPSGPAPTVGADTDDVLTDLGYSRSEIDDLRRSGVVG